MPSVLRLSEDRTRRAIDIPYDTADNARILREGGFYFARMQEVFDEQVIDTARPDSLIIDVGSLGNRFSDAKLARLREKNVHVLSLDADVVHMQQHLATLRSENTHGVAFDLRQLPSVGQEVTSLKEIMKLTPCARLESMQEKIARLIILLTNGTSERPVDTYYFSHLFAYLSGEERERILRIAFQTLPVGGRMLAFERTPFGFRGYPEHARSVSSGIEHMKSLAGESDYSVQEWVHGFLLTADQFAWYQRKAAAQSCYIDPLLRRDLQAGGRVMSRFTPASADPLSSVVGSALEIIPMHFPQQYLDAEVVEWAAAPGTREPPRYFYMGNAERVLIIAKNAPRAPESGIIT